MLFVLFVCFCVCLVGFNFIKLLFFGTVHNRIHLELNKKCFLCQRVYVDHLKIFNLAKRRLIIWRTCLASLITIGSTVFTLTLFRYLLNQFIGVSLRYIILIVLALIILVFISLWNMLTVVFVFWYEFSFYKASNLSIELLFVKLKNVVSMTLILTTVFLLAVSLGSLVIFQIPSLFLVIPSDLVNPSFIPASQSIVVVVSGIIFLGWIVLSNIFFNVAMLILFDQLINGLKFSNGLLFISELNNKQVVINNN